MKAIIKDSALLPYLMKGFEVIGAKWSLFGRAYHQLFYAPMLRKELQLTHLSKGAEIIHIGCGPLPLTALYLAREGFSVVAIDNDPKALERAREVVRQNYLEDKIEVVAGDGVKIDYSPYEAVWISLHAWPQAKIIERALETMKEGGTIICRNSRSYLKALYSSIQTQGLTSCYITKKRQLLGKETLLLKKSQFAPQRLSYLPKGIEGCLSNLPDEPLLMALGLRLGKRILVQAKEPFQGPIIAEVEGRKVALSLDLAEKILVESR